MPKSRKSFSVKIKSRRLILKKARATTSLDHSQQDLLVTDTDESDSFSSDVDIEQEIEPNVFSAEEMLHSNDSSYSGSDIEPETIQKHLSVSGRRIVDLKYFLDALKSLQHVGFGCSFFDIDVISEKIEGLESTLTFKCNVCNKIDTVKTGDIESSFGSANRAGVISAISVGIGYTQFSEMLATIDIPQMSNKTYLKYHNSISSSVNNVNQRLMTEAAIEETKLSEETNIDHIPTIAVIADGAWGKRSYRRNYSSLSGVASIIGAKTKKNLYMDVKNKYCFLCARGRDTHDHECFRNWSKTSTAMESAIILEGFKQSISRHNLIYSKLIGDGDSSVYKKLTEIAPYGPSFYINKIECRNHLLRNYINKLSDLSKDSKYPKYRRDYICSPSSLGRFRNAVVKAIAHRKEETIPLDTRIDNLKNDILNSPYHILGRHQQCQKYFCNGAKDGEEDLVDVYSQCGLLEAITTIVQRLASHASSLLYDTDTNPAETFNSIVAKFMAAISYNSGGKLLSLLHEDLCGRPPGHYMAKFLNTKIRRDKHTTTKRCSRTRRFAVADCDYGMPDDSIFSDLCQEEYEMKATEFLNDLQNFYKKKIETGTLTQSKSDVWKVERKKRLTASNFGKVCKLRKTTCTSKTVSFLLYNLFRGNIYTNFGIDSESKAIEEFEKIYKLEVVKCGLMIDEEMPFLACSPDGLVQNDSVIEIKSSLKSGEHDPLEACRLNLIDYCVLNSEKNKIMLKRNHNYYYQIQGILHITKRTKCYFIVYTQKGIHVEEIERDDTFWRERMIQKLKEFYVQSLLPELVDSRRCRGLKIRTVYMSN
ncbi:hypothetical protein RN001_006146 [Aquatica leii]|uniref:YqaJ viral recombinase domain-containing protein n=1 Tax=Aquatica leii TaxID=1421715 RepID=A0AAN7SIF3_9COLE|nr:hypothetical protein RN001_006146 [Aquatica leii]